MSSEKQTFREFIDEKKKIPYMQVFPYAWIVIFIKLLFWFIFTFNIHQIHLLWEIPLCATIGLIGAFISTIAAIVICFSLGIIAIAILYFFTCIAYLLGSTAMLINLRDAGLFLDKCVTWFLKGEERPF